jgi:hypothetical protein
MRESKIEKKVTEFAEENGMLHYKFTSPMHSFVPDHLYITPKGTVFFIEFKKLGEKPGPGQTREIKRLRGHKAMVFVVDNIDYGKGVICGLIDD